MYKPILTTVLFAVLASSQLTAQEKNETKERKEKKQENIIIKKKGDKNEKVTVVVDGETITVNGMPIEDFNDENLEIITRKGKAIANEMAPRIRKMVRSFDGTGVGASNKAFLGVTSEIVEQGAKITGITKASAAEKAGLQIGDIITKIGSEKIDEKNGLFTAIGKYKPEEKIMITYIRNGAEATTEASLDKNKTSNIVTWNSEGFDMEAPEGMHFFNSFPRTPKVGLQIEDVEEGDGVKILGVDENTPAEKAGLKKDDVLTEIDGANLKNVDELRIKMKAFKEGDSFKVKYKRGNKSQTTEIKLPKKLKRANL
ncbi:MAG: PDZ domain-containing protein [Chitinophagaceae bacterium]|nr:PDZ domain-containing protein [Chitinophagaceae bacterium]MBP9740577.1 PDZ domain-containing protein [Chitinophagaceae bacterium]